MSPNSANSSQMEVAIIGGGIAGLVLALTLHNYSVKCTIYELRQTADVANPGAIGLAPNAIRILDKLGLKEQLRDVSWPLRAFQFRNESDELISSITIGDIDQYGYDTFRIVRRRLHDVLLAAAEAAGVKMITGKKFSHVVDTTPSAVTFAFTDNTEATASILVGADGIHSTVRKLIAPTVEPAYQGSLTVAAKLTQNPLLALPSTDTLESRAHSIAVNYGTNSAFIVIAQSSDGQEVSVGLDRPYPDQSRDKWDALLDNQQQQYEMMTEDYDKWPEMVQLFIRAVKPEDMYRSWPFYALPDMEQWSTSDRRVIIVGDAAHAVPPSAGQGACMAVEDAWSLGVVLSLSQQDAIDTTSSKFQDRVSHWQGERRTRVGKMRTLTKQMGNARLPKEMREKLDSADYFEAGHEDSDLSWLYGYEFEARRS